MSSEKRRAPAFQFYADDFLAGTLDLSQADVGAYIRLLCHQWNRGSIPVETEKQQRLAGGSVSVDVLAKFRLVDGSRLVNERLEQERQKQANYRRLQSEKGKLSAESRQNQPEVNRGSTEPPTAVQPSPQPDTQPEVNSPSPSPSPSPSMDSNPAIAGGAGGRKRFVPPTLQDLELHVAKIGLPPIEASKFHAYHSARGWMLGKVSMKSWEQAMVTWKLNYDERRTTEGRNSRGNGTNGSRVDAGISGIDQWRREFAEEAARDGDSSPPGWDP